MASGDLTGAQLGRRRTALFSRRSAGEVTFSIFNVLALLLFCFSILYPFWHILLTSFSGPSELVEIGFRFWIEDWSIRAYRFAVSEYGNATTGYVNSVIRTVIGTALTVVVTLLMAYPLAKRDLPGRTLLTMYVVFTLFFSGGLIPLYIVVRQLGLMDTRLALVLPVMANGFYIIIMRNYLMTVDSAFEESAMIDGAGYVQILVRIIIPLAKPIIAVIALWAAVYHWNEWFHALIFTRSRDKHVLQFLLRRMLQNLSAVQLEMVTFEEDIDLLPFASVRSAITVLTIGPIILIYPFIQRFFTKGIFVGSLKG